MRLRPLASTLRSLLIVLALLLAAAGMPGVASAQSAIPRYAELQRDVDFWIRIYSQVPTSRGLLHDPVDLSIVYGDIAIPPGQPGSPARRSAA